MTNTQLWIAIAIPSILVVLSWIQQSTRMARIEVQMDDLRKEMIQLRKDIHTDMITFRKEIHEDLLGLHERVAVVETKQR